MLSIYPVNSIADNSFCETELPLVLKDNPPKLVMNALINADSLTNVLYLNFTGRGYATHVENATVEVRVNGQLSESLRPLPPQTEGDMQCRFHISSKFTPRRCSSYRSPSQTTDNITHGLK